MKSFFAVPALALALFSASVAADECLKCGVAGNNCARGVAGTGAHIKEPLATRMADCAAAMVVTVTPTPVVVVVTETLAPSPPAYATYCAGPASYGSACACAGVTAPTVTAEAATVTITTTVAARTCAVAPRFAMRS